MENDYRKNKFMGVIILGLWVMSGGMMTVHVVLFLLGTTNLMLLILGLFIPPVGIINALTYIFTGETLNSHFWEEI